MHTQCPKCRTVFKVTEQILAVKAGLVRCGDCDNVFNATWNLVDDPDEDYQDAGPSPVISRRDPDTGDDDGDGDPYTAKQEPGREQGDDDPRGEAFDFADEGDEWDDSQPGSSDDEDDDASALHAEREAEYDRRDGFEAPAGESGFIRETNRNPWEELDDEDDSIDISDEEIRRTLHLDQPFDENEADSDLPPGDDERAAPGLRAETTVDTPASLRPPGSRGARERIEPRLDAASESGLSVNAEDALLPHRARASHAGERSPLKRRPAIQLKSPVSPAQRDADPEPAQRNAYQRVDPNVHWISIPDDNRRGAQFLWASGVLLLVALLLVQVRFLLVDDLYAIPGTRPYISLFCELTGCSAPQRADPGAIDIAQTRVDLHPDVPGAIRINVNLINRAAFAQPYPALELTLSDTDGRIVGRRTYQPSDYLREDTEETALLDPGILAVASINLAHPNENAVGFETRVVAPSNP